MTRFSLSKSLVLVFLVCLSLASANAVLENAPLEVAVIGKSCQGNGTNETCAYSHQMLRLPNPSLNQEIGLSPIDTESRVFLPPGLEVLHAWQYEGDRVFYFFGLLNNKTQAKLVRIGCGPGGEMTELWQDSSEGIEWFHPLPDVSSKKDSVYVMRRENSKYYLEKISLLTGQLDSSFTLHFDRALFGEAASVYEFQTAVINAREGILYVLFLETKTPLRRIRLFPVSLAHSYILTPRRVSMVDVRASVYIPSTGRVVIFGQQGVADYENAGQSKAFLSYDGELESVTKYDSRKNVYLADFVVSPEAEYVILNTFHHDSPDSYELVYYSGSSDSVAKTPSQVSIGNTSLASFVHSIRTFDIPIELDGEFHETSNQLYPTDSLPNDLFGFSSCSYKNTLAVTSPFYEEGRVTIFTFPNAEAPLHSLSASELRIQRVEQQIFQGAPVDNNDIKFGMSSDMDGDFLVVGAADRGGTDGYVKIFVRDECGNFTSDPEIIERPTNYGLSSKNGWAHNVAVTDIGSGEALIVVSAHLTDYTNEHGSTSQSGMVVLYHRNSLGELTPYPHYAPWHYKHTEGAQFGSAIALRQKTLVVAAGGEEKVFFIDLSTKYDFDVSLYSVLTRDSSSYNPHHKGTYGASLAVSPDGKTVAVGAPTGSMRYIRTALISNVYDLHGTAHVFKRDVKSPLEFEHVRTLRLPECYLNHDTEEGYGTQIHINDEYISLGSTLRSVAMFHTHSLNFAVRFNSSEMVSSNGHNVLFDTVVVLNDRDEGNYFPGTAGRLWVNELDSTTEETLQCSIVPMDWEIPYLTPDPTGTGSLTGSPSESASASASASSSSSPSSTGAESGADTGVTGGEGPTASAGETSSESASSTGGVDSGAESSTGGSEGETGSETGSPSASSSPSSSLSPSATADNGESVSPSSSASSSSSSSPSSTAAESSTGSESLSPSSSASPSPTPSASASASGGVSPTPTPSSTGSSAPSSTGTSAPPTNNPGTGMPGSGTGKEQETNESSGDGDSSGGLIAGIIIGLILLILAVYFAVKRGFFDRFFSSHPIEGHHSFGAMETDGLYGPDMSDVEGERDGYDSYDEDEFLP